MKNTRHFRILLAMLLLAALNTIMAEPEPNALPAVVKLTDVWIETEETPTYHGWPTLIRLQDGRLAAVCSGHRKAHIDPFGRVYFYTSKDDGKTWSAPKALSNGPLDDRDAGIIQLPDGAILVNYFTSLAFLSCIRDGRKISPDWQEAMQNITLAQCNEGLGQFMLRSTDGGATWEDKWAVPVGNVHGPCLLKDGALLWVGRNINYNRQMTENRYDDSVIACRSEDGGRTWQQLARLPEVPGQKQTQWHEVHQIQTADGTIVCHIRNENPSAKMMLGADFAGGATTWQSESTDGGRTWTTPHLVCYGVCNHLLNLPDGRLLMTYGYRKAPCGVRARLSGDNGQTWGDELVLCDDGDNGDLGYPSTVVLPDGSLATLWYQNRKAKGMASLRCLRWRLQDAEK